MPDVNERPNCPPGCWGFETGTCNIDHATGKMGHETLFPARSIIELFSLRRMRVEFWRIVRRFRDMFADELAFSVDTSWRLIRPEFGTA